MIIMYEQNIVDRESLAIRAANAMCGIYTGSFEPYKPTAHDDSFWTIDKDNNWKLQFFEDSLNKVAVIHRYGNREAVTLMTNWFAYQTGGEVR